MHIAQLQSIILLYKYINHTTAETGKNVFNKGGGGAFSTLFFPMALKSYFVCKRYLDLRY